MRLNDDDAIRALRKKLRQMTECEAREHRTCLAGITADISNTIRIVEFDVAEDRYTCGMHAFGFERNEDYAAIAGHGLGRVYAGTDFFNWVLAERLLDEISEAESNEGDLVMYFDQGNWTHVGRLTEERRAISKWGVGLLYHHGLSEVPEQYGQEVRFFRNPGPEASMGLFMRYAALRGIRFE